MVRQFSCWLTIRFTPFWFYMDNHINHRLYIPFYPFFNNMGYFMTFTD